MAGFKMHVGTSTLCGVAYAGTGIAMGAPWDSALVAGGLCAVSGMLPDVDSSSGRPVRETMGFAAAVVPMLLVDRFQQLGLTYEQMVLAAGGLYLLIRFGIAKLLSKYTVHRGMFHSIPAALTFAGVAFLICGCSNLQMRYFKAGAVLLGVMSHLILDEIYSIQLGGIQGVKLKSSSGTALKLWGPSWAGNISTYAKLTIVVLLILGEPMVMERYGEVTPWAIQHASWNVHDSTNGTAVQANAVQPNAVQANAFQPNAVQPISEAFETGLPIGSPDTRRLAFPSPPAGGMKPLSPLTVESQSPPRPVRDRTIYDTARRLKNKFLPSGPINR